MKKTTFLFFTCVLASLLAGCSSSDDDELKCEEFAWENVSYPSKKINGDKYYVVPRQGGDYTFTMEVYNTKNTMRARFRESYDNPAIATRSSWHDSFNGSVKIDGSSVEITFMPNDNVTRYCNMSFSDPMNFGYLYFVQEGAK